MEMTWSLIGRAGHLSQTVGIFLRLFSSLM